MDATGSFFFFKYSMHASMCSIYISTVFVIADKHCPLCRSVMRPGQEFDHTSAAEVR